MPRMTLTGMPGHHPVVLSFEADTRFTIENGPEGATILGLHRQGSQQIVHVRETCDQIIAARAAALWNAPSR